MVRWKTIDDVPEGYYRETVEQLMADGILKGKDGGIIDITEDMLRSMIFCQRIIGKTETDVEKLTDTITDKLMERIKNALEDIT